MQGYLIHHMFSFTNLGNTHQLPDLQQVITPWVQVGQAMAERMTGGLYDAPGDEAPNSNHAEQLGQTLGSIAIPLAVPAVVAGLGITAPAAGVVLGASASLTFATGVAHALHEQAEENQPHDVKTAVVSGAVETVLSHIPATPFSKLLNKLPFRLSLKTLSPEVIKARPIESLKVAGDIATLGARPMLYFIAGYELEKSRQQPDAQDDALAARNGIIAGDAYTLGNIARSLLLAKLRG